jgi:hypothetical protein
MEGTMIDNTNVYRCACRVKGLAHSFSAVANGNHVVMVDPSHAHLLGDITWTVSRMHSKSKLLRARASASAPGIKIGSQLHQLVMPLRGKGRRVWAINRNYLDTRCANLRPVSYADVRILSSSRPSTKAVGVSRPPQPKFFKTLLRPFHATIMARGKKLDLAWWSTLEEASAAYDAAALMVHGPTATTNQSLGLLSPEMAATTACRIAVKTARRVVHEHKSGEYQKRIEALKTAKTYQEKMEVWAGVRAVGQPLPGPRVEVAKSAAG